MLRYETLVLTPPDITREQINTLESHLSSIAQKSNGKVLQFDEWGKYYLAYPVKKSNYGCYFLARIEIPEMSSPTVVSDITSAMQIKCVEYVWRHVVKKLEAGASLDYKRPESVASSAKSKFDRKPGESFGRSATSHEASDNDLSVDVDAGDFDEKE